MREFLTAFLALLFAFGLLFVGGMYFIDPPQKARAYVDDELQREQVNQLRRIADTLNRGCHQ